MWPPFASLFLGFFLTNHENTICWKFYYIFFNIRTVIHNFFQTKYAVESVLQLSKEKRAKKNWFAADMILAVLLIWNQKIKRNFNVYTCGYDRFQNYVKILEIKCLTVLKMKLWFPLFLSTVLAWNKKLW